MNRKHSAIINDTATLLSLVAVSKEPRLMRQCPKCVREWPFDWEYCADCAISLQGREITKQVIRLVPAESSGAGKENSITALAQYTDGLFLACEFQCDSDPPSPEHFRHGNRLMPIAMEAITSYGGTASALPDRGIVGYWNPGADNTDMAVRAATKILAEASQNDRETRWRSPDVSFGLGIVSSKGGEKSPRDNIKFVLRLASLAHPNGGLVCQAVYEETVQRFDYRGVCPAVPRSDPLPAPVFKLLARIIHG